MAHDHTDGLGSQTGREALPLPDDITQEICRHRGFLILEAGAGTGKTHNLTKRVIHQLVERKVPLERMLALTFTDFAAAEMRSRVYDAINRNIDDSEHLLTARRRFSRNYISTFHSFCNRILQYFPDELTEISVPDAPPALDRAYNERSVDGGLELLGDYDEVLWMMEWRKQFYRKYKAHEGLGRQLARLSVSDFEKFMHKLSGLDEQALEELASLSPEKFPVWLRGVSEPWRKEWDALVRELLDAFATVPHWFTSPDKIPKSMEGLAAIQNKDGKFSKKAFDRNERDDEALAGLDEKSKALAGYETALAALDDYLARPGLAVEIAAYPAGEDFDPEHEAYWNMRDLAELGMRWGTLMRYQRFEAGYFNYDDMIWLTHRLFTENPSVAARMRARFDQILVDEFQDTDRLQWEILCKLAFSDGTGSGGGASDGEKGGTTGEEGGGTGGEERGTSGGKEGGASGGEERGTSGDDKELLVVGDVKQAIYGFRGGDVAMMRRVENELSQRGGEPGALPLLRRPLPYSFRSNEAVVTLANRLFRDVFGPQTQAASYEAYHQPLGRPPGNMSRNADAPGEIRVLRADGKALGEELKRQAGQIQPDGSSAGGPYPDDTTQDGTTAAGTHPAGTTPSMEAIQLASYPVHLEARRIARFLREIYDGRREGYDAIRQKMRNGEKAVGVLYRRRKYMYALEDALREAGLPYTVAKGTSYYMRREVRDAWLLLSFLLDAYDDISLVGLLRSPMVSLSDSGLLAMRVVMDERQHDYPNFWSAVSDHGSWSSRLSDSDRMALEAGVPLLERLRENVPFRRVSELLEEAFFTSGPYLGGSPDDPQVRENLVKLLDVVRNLESSGRGTLFEVTGFLSNRIREEAGDSEAEHAEPAPVQLMTIHGSKGLEFPMVVLPDMYAGDNQGGVQLYLADDDPDSFLWPALAYKSGDSESDKEAEASFLFRILKAERTKRQRAEIKRLFYVAVTRAETHVLLSLSRPNSKKAGSFAELLEPWLADQEGDAEQKIFEIEDLTPEQLEELAIDRRWAGDDTGEPVADPERIRIPDRGSPLFVQAGAQVSAEIRSASGKRSDAPGIEEDEDARREAVDSGEVTGRDIGVAGRDDGDAGQDAGDAGRDARDAGEEAGLPSQWSGMSPADAGTLVHRTLEMGLDAGVGDEAASTRELEDFWRRELFRMDVADPGIVAAANRDELRRHCRKARNWIRDQFGEDAPRRFEVSFEVSVPLSRLDGEGSQKGEGTRKGEATRKGGDRTEDESIGNSSEGDGAVMAAGPEQHSTMRGSIDMMIRDREGHLHIVDFKSGPVPDSDAGMVVRHAVSMGYDRQIRNYLIAAESTEEMAPERVWLLFTAPAASLAVRLTDF